MFDYFLPKARKLFINDRHEEADTDKDNRLRLYDKRILPLLSGNDLAIFGEKIDKFLWDYYRKLGLAEIKQANVFYVKSYLNYPSLTKAALKDQKLLKEIKERKIDIVVPYIESYDTKKLSKKISSNLLREPSLVDQMNNKNRFRNIAKSLNIPVIEGKALTLSKIEKFFKYLKSKGYKRVILKKERSVSGYGVFIVEKLSELIKCLKDNFQQEKKIVMEGYVEDVVSSPNLQYFIMDNRIEFIAATDQLFRASVIHMGNSFPFRGNKKILLKLKKKSLAICKHLQKRKCFGLIGVDFVITKDNIVYPTEINVRLNGSTFPVFIAKKMFPKENNIHWISKCFRFNPKSFKKIFYKFSYFIKPGNKFGVFPVGVDLAEKLGEGEFIIIADSQKKLSCIYNNFLSFLRKI